MIVLALDTTTRAGSLAILRDNQLLDTWSGDPTLTHAARLPDEILGGLTRNGLTLRDIDLYGVAAGPGSFTGLRIGISTIQGLAFANAKPVVGVSALDALARSTGTVGKGAIATLMDARRGEVFAALYIAEGAEAPLDPRPSIGPVVEPPDVTLSLFAERMGDDPVTWAGDGALEYRSLIDGARGARPWRVSEKLAALAPAVAEIAAFRARQGLAGPPHAVRPVYVRRPDAELARDRREKGGESQTGGRS